MTSLKDHLEKLVGFLAVARHQSLSRAARELRVSQPSLSHSVKVLEEVLETALIARGSRGITLTAAGEDLFALAGRLLDETAAFESRLRMKNDAPGKLSIGTKAPYAVHLWPRYLDLLYREFPTLEVGLHIERTNSALLEGLAARRFDLVFLPDPGDSIDAFEICRDSFAFYASRRTRGEMKLNAQPLILFRNALGGGNRTLGERLAKLLPPRVHEVDSFDAAAAQAAEGLGLAVLPRILGDAGVAGGKLRRAKVSGVAEDFFPEVRICLVAHPTLRGTPAVRQLVKRLRAIAKAEAPVPLA